MKLGFPFYCLGLLMAVVVEPTTAQDRRGEELRSEFWERKLPNKLRGYGDPTVFRPMHWDDPHRWDPLDTADISAMLLLGLSGSKSTAINVLVKVGPSFRVDPQFPPPSKRLGYILRVEKMFRLYNPMPIARQSNFQVIESIYRRPEPPQGASQEWGADNR